LLVLHRGKLQYEAYWEGSNADTPVYSFSMHKTIVGMMVGFAIADGKIGSVEDSVAKYLPEWSDPEHSKIRIKHLLQMSSGIESMQYGDNPFSKHQRRQIGTDLASTALSFDVQEPPGQRFDYNGVNPTLLVMIIERTTGRRLRRVPVRETLEAARQSYRARLARPRGRARVRSYVAVRDPRGTGCASGS
jgi:CubicO group peptidase (beta-lactamase class C family)